MEVFTAALTELTVVKGEVVCDDGQPFDRESYSLFKYGYLPPATDYGNGLARLIGNQLLDYAGEDRVVIISAPYKHLPTASHAIAEVLCRQLSVEALQRKLEPPRLLPFHKSRPGSDRYAESTELERLASLATMGLYLDELQVRGSHVVVVDDIRVTGSAQRATAHYLEGVEPASVWYLHAARFPEGIGKEQSSREKELNLTVKPSIGRIIEQVEAGTFRLNTRVLRFLMETDQAGLFCAIAPLPLLREIYWAGVGNGLAYYTKYEERLKQILRSIEVRSTRTILVS